MHAGNLSLQQEDARKAKASLIEVPMFDSSILIGPSIAYAKAFDFSFLSKWKHRYGIWYES